MQTDKRISDFLDRLKPAAGANLLSVILYGSSVAGDFHPDFSDLNLLLVLERSSFSVLETMAPSIEWWHKQKQRTPLLMTRQELERSADVFAIELLDMQANHRVLYGQDVLSGMVVPRHLHRAQVEYELREKLILLRQNLLVAARDSKQIWRLLTASIPAFATLFRHALIATGDAIPATKRESVQALAARIGFDPNSFLQVLDVRERKLDPKTLNVKTVAARYLEAAEQVTAAVDKMLDRD